MTVKDVQSVNLQRAQSEAPSVRPLTLSSLNTSKVQADSVLLRNDGTLRPTQVQQQVRAHINEAIDATNVASSAVDDISKLISGISGIVEQVNGQDLPPQHVAILEKEANQLKDEIARAAERSSSSGIKPLLGDKITVQVEETLGKTLEVILPDNAKEAFGLGTIQFSPKELIVNTVVSVEKARQGIEDLRKKLADGVDAVRTTVLAFDVAQQNNEASQSRVRDVDQALALAGDTKSEIRRDPDNALASVGDIAQQAPELLRQ